MTILNRPVSAGFEEKFIDAVNVFKYQLVFDTVSKTVVPLTPYPKGKNALDFPGAGIPFLAKVNNSYLNILSFDHTHKQILTPFFRARSSILNISLSAHPFGWGHACLEFCAASKMLDSHLSI